MSKHSEVKEVKGKWVVDNTKFETKAQAELFLKVKESIKVDSNVELDSTSLFSLIVGIALIKQNPKVNLNDLALDIVNEFGDTVDEIKEEFEC